ncbi:hypothetical protein LX36DRAFT_163537 [Colletotrichum falcatum]|nr:hypothetical protein LX36DRAFT_163537 [Colletotrichum falcatum]
MASRILGASRTREWRSKWLVATRCVWQDADQGLLACRTSWIATPADFPAGACPRTSSRPLRILVASQPSRRRDAGGGRRRDPRGKGPACLDDGIERPKQKFILAARLGCYSKCAAILSHADREWPFAPWPRCSVCPVHKVGLRSMSEECGKEKRRRRPDIRTLLLVLPPLDPSHCSP